MVVSLLSRYSRLWCLCEYGFSHNHSGHTGNGTASSSIAPSSEAGEACLDIIHEVLESVMVAILTKHVAEEAASSPPTMNSLWSHLGSPVTSMERLLNPVLGIHKAAEPNTQRRDWTCPE